MTQDRVPDAATCRRHDHRKKAVAAALPGDSTVHPRQIPLFASPMTTAASSQVADCHFTHPPSDPAHLQVLLTCTFVPAAWPALRTANQAFWRFVAE